MTADNKSQLSKVMDEYLKYAVDHMAQLVKNKIDEYIRLYYHEYSPKEYQRTWNFLNSVVKTEAKKVGDTWTAEVYIDTSIIYKSTWNQKPWTMGNTAYQANQGKHGSYQGNVHFFDDAKRDIEDKKHLTNSFANFLKTYGIDVSYRFPK